MDISAWLERWRQNHIGFHKDQVNPHLQKYYPSLKLAAGDRVLVPLCGKSLDMGWLRRQRQKVVGVEISPIAIRDFFREYGCQPHQQVYDHYERWTCDDIELLCGDYFAIEPEDVGEVAAVYDRAALIALGADFRPAYVRHLQGLLAVGTPMLLIALEYPRAQMGGPPYSVPEDEVRQLFAPGFKIELLEQNDNLAIEPRFLQRGLTQLSQKVYLLHRL